jgi:hypothetical protein
MQIAQTNVQLYNHLRERGLPLNDLIVVHRAYELLTTLYPGYVQADDKPFTAHGAGVASILGEPRLARMLSSAFAAAAANPDGVPAELRPSDHRPHLKLIVPRSCRRRLAVRAGEAIRRQRARLRLRTRFRQSVGAA